MRTSPQGVAEIASHEGLVLSPYYDSVGVPTFGCGHTKNAGPPDPLSFPLGKDQPLERILAVFRADLAKFEDRVTKAVTVPLAQHEFDALVSFDFNCGGIYKAMLTKRLNQGDRAAAIAAFDGWHKPPEIIGRRNKQKALFASGTYSGGGMATVYPADGNGKVTWSKGRKVNVLELMGGFPVPVIDPPFAMPPDWAPPEKSTEPPRGGLIGLLTRIFNAVFGGK